MPSNKRTSSRPDGGSTLLFRKLRILEEMLAVTEKLRRDGRDPDHLEADGFRQRICSLVEKAREVDRLLDDRSSPTGAPPASEEEELEKRIQDTVSRLTEANLSLVASVKAWQAIIGGKIAKLKDGRDWLKTYRPDIPREPSWFDSDA